MNFIIILFYKLCTLFSRTPASQIEHNRKSNMNFIPLLTPGQFIERQSALSDMRMGNRSIGFCGCGAIAVYNVLLSLYKDIDVNEFLTIIGSFERKGLTLKGRFGISPVSIRNYFRQRNLYVESTSSANPLKINAIGETNDAFICTIYNKNNNIMKGIHHIAVTKDSAGNYISHNPHTESKTLSDAINKASLYNGSALYVTGVRKSM